MTKNALIAGVNRQVANESARIPAGGKHALEHPGLLKPSVLVLQRGAYSGEDDSLRFDDKYGRCK
jgi:mannose-1-phosphate guanylyltransferase/mannose-6-phosphate isomerase